ncbi:hypothetical protein PVAP13_8NG136100 [Panicum virgatum]|uniref:Knottin scorpion toxin-like domain-containing protein n=1 Tax=Panicum virgatum TaxID=38727 RepID=A0A8T0P7P5_PANVG|nr:hypothetical protein PVAP13_8NG136100 [Panicum virgatum]
MSFRRKNLVVAGLLLALLLIASFHELPGARASYSGGRGLCDVSTGLGCTSDAVCRAICKPRARGDYVDAYCSKDRPAPGCVCQQLCGDDGRPSTPPLAAGGRASAAGEAGDDNGRRRIGR